jgi:uncharacterized damage-inducible protein DinB
MDIREFMLTEFDREMANTRKLLERTPMAKPDWKPHEKSMTMARLAGHVAELPGWAVSAMHRDTLDLTPMISGGQRGYAAESVEDLLKTFDRNVIEARKAIADANDQKLQQTWSLVLNGKTLLSMPRIAVLRNMMMNHLIHHRAQLGVYLRLNDVPVPGMYGTSADEGPSFSFGE